MINKRPYCVAKECNCKTDYPILNSNKDIVHIKKSRCVIDKDFKCPKQDEFLTRCERCNDVFEFNGSYLCPRCRGVV